MTNNSRKKRSVPPLYLFLLFFVLAAALPVFRFTPSFAFSDDHAVSSLVPTKHPRDTSDRTVKPSVITIHDRDVVETRPTGTDSAETTAASPPSQSGAVTASDTTQTPPSSAEAEDPLDPELHATEVTNSSCNMPRPPQYPLIPPQEEVPQLIHDYLAFHKTARACLLNPECKQKPKTMVMTCPRSGPCYGFGDRMRGIVFSFIVALVTKRVFFLHDMSESFSLEAGLSPASVDWTLPPNIEYNASWPYLEWYWCRHDIRQPCDEKMRHLVLTHFTDFDDHFINMFTEDIVKLFDAKGPNIALACRVGYLKMSFLEQNPYFNNTYAELSRAITARQFSIHKLLFQPSEATKQMLKTLEFSGEYLSVHIRNGVDTNEIDKKRFVYMSSHEEEIVDNILKCVGRLSEETRITKVFLASDSSSTKELFARKRKEKMFLDVHMSEKKALHYDQQELFGSTTWDSRCEGFISIFADLFMLARGEHMLVTGSNLGAFASYLGGHREIVRLNTRKTSVDDWCQLKRVY